MRRDEVLVVFEHRHLRVPDALKRLEVQLHLAVSAQIRNIAQAVNHNRHDHEKHHAGPRASPRPFYKAVRGARERRVFIPMALGVDALFIERTNREKNSTASPTAP